MIAEKIIRTGNARVVFSWITNVLAKLVKHFGYLRTRASIRSGINELHPGLRVGATRYRNRKYRFHSGLTRDGNLSSV